MGGVGRPDRIAGSFAVVTGASSGLGVTFARKLDERGARLLITGRRLDALDQLASTLTNAETLACDLALPDELERLVERAVEADIVVANAALPAAGALDDFTPAEIDRALDVNLRAPIQLARQVAPHMARRGRGHLVFVASMGAKLPASRLSLYVATKNGLRGFAACLRQELAPAGVGVSVLFPGSVHDVGMWAEAGVSGKVPTVSSEAVADALVRAIDRNRAEVDIAPFALRIAAALAALAPQAYAWGSRHAGADRETAALAAGLRHKR
jgi:short-subunit dehydrogenase